jgi:teichoic acid transport system ATP-binding protein
MDELKRRGTTILMVTHDLGSVMKYCDRVVLLNKGKKVAEGRPGEMVDLYKKILAGQYEDNGAASAFIEKQNFGVDSVGGAAMSLAEEKAAQGKNRESAQTEAQAETQAQAGAPGTAKEKGQEKDQGHASYQEQGPGTEGGSASGGSGALPQGKMMDQLNLNPNVQHYGNGKADIYDFGILDAHGHVTNVVLKGEVFSIREKIRFLDTVQSPIFTFTIKDKRGQDLTGTNTMFEGREIPEVKAGDSYTCTFTQRMTLQGGEYLLSMSCTGFEMGTHTVYDRKYDIANITVLSNKNTVGVYDMESEVTLERHEKI